MRADAEQLPEHDAFTPGVWKHGELSNSGDKRGVLDAAPAAKKRTVVGMDFCGVTIHIPLCNRIPTLSL